jgi:hypothetical protein
MIQKGCPRREAIDTFQSASGLGARGERRERQKKKQRDPLSRRKEGLSCFADRAPDHTRHSSSVDRNRWYYVVNT